MIRRLLIGAAVLASAVVATASPSLDGYTFEQAQFQHLTVRVQFVPIKTEAEMARLAGSFGVPSKGGIVKAFSVRRADETCVIYAEDPTVQYEPEFIGHELAHCLFGNFHPTKTKELSK